MIKEILQFVDSLPESAFSQGLRLKEGLYLLLDIQEENGEFFLKNNKGNDDHKLIDDDAVYIDKRRQPENYIEQSLLSYYNNSLILSSNKSYLGRPGMFLEIGSPFSIRISKENAKSLIDNSHEEAKKASTDLGTYFKTAGTFTEEHNYDKFLRFKGYCQKHLSTFLRKNSEKIDRAKKSIYLFLKDATVDDYSSSNSRYLEERILNQKGLTKDLEYGVNDLFFNYNEGKPFKKHTTAPFIYSLRMSKRDTVRLLRFCRLLENKQLPNPLPIFIKIDELPHSIYDTNAARLNQYIVVLHQAGQVTKYSDLIIQLAKHTNNDLLQNFYLIFWKYESGQATIRDVDFVPAFKLKTHLTINEILANSKDSQPSKSKHIQNKFQLEHLLSNSIFTQRKNHIETEFGILNLHYFSERILPSKGYRISDATVNILYKYRKAIYEYVYKSRNQSITCAMFDDMILTSILDDIRNDQVDKNGHSTRQRSIKEKLNIWFSLWNHFANNQDRINMANRTVEILNQLKIVIQNENVHIQNDEEFAFASGQLIWKILIQSESSNRSHAMLEPFLQKTESSELKKSIVRAFDNYKHRFSMYRKKYAFDKIMSEVMGYNPQETNMRNLTHIILAGYFSESLLK